MSQDASKDVEVKLSYLQGTLDQVIVMLKEDRKEVLDELVEIRTAFKEHSKEDHEAFKAQEETTEALQQMLASQRGYIAGATAVILSVVTLLGLYLEYLS